jgi:hypothetical protein
MAAVALLPNTQKEVYEDEVTLFALAKAFQLALYDVAFEENDDYFMVESDLPSVEINLDEAPQYIHFTTFIPVKESAPLRRKYAFINKMNIKFTLPRFVILESHPDSVAASCCIPYQHGVSPIEVVSIFRRFSLIIYYAIRALKDNNLLDTENPDYPIGNSLEI